MEQQELNIKVSKIKAIFESRGMEVKEVLLEEGPAVTLFKLAFQDRVDLDSVMALRDDLGTSLSVRGVRILRFQESLIGLEVPNWHREQVSFHEVFNKNKDALREYELPLILGETFGGDPVNLDLAKAPHLLCAGATKQGNSILVKTLIASLLLTKQPDELQLYLFDPKLVNLTEFKDVAKIFNYPEQSEWALKAILAEMERRFKILAENKVSTQSQYNDISAERLPNIVILIDELADYTLPYGNELFARSFRDHLISIAQLGRSVGVHVIAVTQRPSKDVINAYVKANFSTRVAFRTTTENDSFTVIDCPDAAELTGRGDMLLSDEGELTRFQGCYISEEELNLIVKDASSRGYRQPSLSPCEDSETTTEIISPESLDERFEEVARFVVDKQKASVAEIQRTFGLGYAKATRIMNQLEYFGIVGQLNGEVIRQVLIKTQKELDDLLDKLKIGKKRPDMKKKTEDIRELFVCKCNDPQHQFIIQTIDFENDPAVYISVLLTPVGFFKRLINGIKYIFGHRSKYGDFQEIIINPDDADRLQDVVDMLKEVKKKEVPQNG